MPSGNGTSFLAGAPPGPMQVARFRGDIWWREATPEGLGEELKEDFLSPLIWSETTRVASLKETRSGVTPKWGPAHQDCSINEKLPRFRILHAAYLHHTPHHTPGERDSISLGWLLSIYRPVGDYILPRVNPAQGHCKTAPDPCVARDWPL